MCKKCEYSHVYLIRIKGMLTEILFQIDDSILLSLKEKKRPLPKLCSFSMLFGYIEHRN